MYDAVLIFLFLTGGRAVAIDQIDEVSDWCGSTDQLGDD
jgi:hypothetical protein